VLDSASIQASRRRRNAKTDRIDVEGLVRVLMVLQRGEAKVCSVVHVSTPEEDVQRLHRSRHTLIYERVRHVNRIKGLLKPQGVHNIEPNREGWLRLLTDLPSRDGRSFPARLMQEIGREAKLRAIAKDLLRELCADIAGLVQAASKRTRKPKRTAAPHPIAARLMQIRGIGPTFASVLATEVFYRKFANRRAVASYVGLTPTACLRPAVRHRAGLALAPQSADEKADGWVQRTGRDCEGRSTRIAMVALARKLVVAL
jgi:transposase